MMKGIFRTSSFIVLAVVGIGFSHEIFLSKRPAENIEIEDEPVVKKVRRKIASLYGPLLKKEKSVTPKVSFTPAVENNFTQNVEPEDLESVSSGSDVRYGSGSGYVSSSNSGSRRVQNSIPSSISKPSTPVIAKVPMLGSGPGPGLGGPLNHLPKPIDPPLRPTQDPDDDPSDDPDLPSPDSLTCSANVGSGAYGNPIQVTLTCSTVATIKYCLGVGACCDPETTGTAYTTPVVIGAEDGNFCLSFVGETASVVSVVVDKNYNISNTFPDLQISFPKIQYQTTQLAGTHHLRSTDFGNAGFEIGEINLKSHDPGTMECHDIIYTYVTLPAPVPVEMFSPLDMLGIASGDQVNVPLAKPELDYGINYITSFVVNNNHPAPLYSCSTNAITLEDFDLFVPEISHGETEFSASFVSYGFMEADADINRTPAGSAQEEDNNQNLSIGSFGMFY